VLILDVTVSKAHNYRMNSDPNASEIYRRVGQHVAVARQERGWTQQQLSVEAGGRLSRSAIANIERGRQRVAVHHLVVIAEALGVPPASLLPRSAKFMGSPAPAADQLKERVLRREGSGFLTVKHPKVLYEGS
jgi:transcriptional regulator with XRE-family HTH domain